MSEEIERLKREMKRGFVMLELRMDKRLEKLEKEGKYENAKKRDGV